MDKEKGYSTNIVYTKEDTPARSISLSKPATSRYDEIKQRSTPKGKTPITIPLNK